RKGVQENLRLHRKYGGAWQRLEQLGAIDWDYLMLELGHAFASRLFLVARELVRLPEETSKPDFDRLPDFYDARLESRKRWLLSEVPIYDDLEILNLADSLAMLAGIGDEGARKVPNQDELARRVLAGKTPRDCAADWARG